MRNKKRKFGFFSGIFGLLGLAITVGCLWLAMSNQDAGPVLKEQPQAARNQVVTMLDALCAGEYETVSACLYGNPGLGMDREAQDEVGRLFWDALADSFQYEIRGDFHATDSGVAMDIMISAMDIDSVTVNLRQRAQTLLEERIAEAEDTSEIYDESNEFREDFVMGALLDAAQDALAEDAKTVSWEITLNLVYEDGQWWIMPEPALLQAISGGILKG
jgi:hypothetical protein